MLIVCDIASTLTLVTITLSSPEPRVALYADRYDRGLQNAAFRVAAQLATAFGRDGLADVIDAGSAAQGIIRVELVDCDDDDDLDAFMDDVISACADCGIGPKE
jgi:hypothetical protein